MGYNENLANRIRAALADQPDVKEKKMFGSLAFMVNNKMCVTAGADRMMCRVDPMLHEEISRNKTCSTVHMQGREYKGFFHVSEDHIRSDRDFNYWIDLAISYNKVAKASKKTTNKR